jgi:hypothetical protein
MNAHPTSVVDHSGAPRLEGRIEYGTPNSASAPAARADHPATATSLEYEAAKWFGPWTVLINRRIGGKLFQTAAR